VTKKDKIIYSFINNIIEDEKALKINLQTKKDISKLLSRIEKTNIRSLSLTPITENKSIENCDELTYCEKSDEEVNLVIIYKKSPTEMADMVGQVLHFLYFNQRALNPENVQPLLEAANYFQVRLVLSVG